VGILLNLCNGIEDKKLVGDAGVYWNYSKT
jgi:hypothetical protein